MAKFTIMPQAAGWRYVGFSLYRLRPGEIAEEATGDREVILVIVEGKTVLHAAGQDWGMLGERMNVFEKTPPHCLYVPNGKDWRAVADTECTIAVCSAPGKGGHAARRIGPDGISLTARGKGTNTRHINNIAMENEDYCDEVRPINEVQVWDLNVTNSGKLVETLKSQGFKASVVDDLETAAGQADIISCATLSHEPLIKFEWLRPGTHLDLIGSFTPHMREADNACFSNGSVYIDSPDALKESGDLICPINDGVMQASDIIGTLSDLCRGQTPVRTSRDQITIFKAVGTGLSDLAAGALAYKNLTA